LNPGLLVGLALVALLVVGYGFELFNYHVTIDDELTAIGPNPFVWVAQDRWFMHLLTTYLFPHAFVPAVPLAIGLAALFGGMLMLARVWGVADGLDLFLVCAVGITTPTLMFLFSFSSLAAGVGIAYLAIAGSVSYFARGGLQSNVIAAAMAAVALGVHQSLGTAVISAYLFLIAAEALAGRKVTTRLLQATAVGLGAVTVHTAAARFLHGVVSPPPSGYLDLFLEPGFLLDHPGSVFRGLTDRAIDTLTGSAGVYGVEVTVLPVLLTVAVACVALAAWRKNPDAQMARLVSIPLGILGLLAPFGGGLLTRGVLDPRFLTGVPIALAGVVALALGVRSRALRGALGTLVVLCTLQFLVSLNALSLSGHLTARRDFALADQIVYAIEALPPQEAGTPLEIVGAAPMPSNNAVRRVSTIGVSIFEHESGSRYRIMALLRLAGLSSHSLVPEGNRWSLVEAVADMPSFPDPGSVMSIRGVIVVKLSEYTPSQVAAICDTAPMPRPIDFCR
jgi:hypothetical protein